ncbi:PIN domain-containing protein [Teichococcus aerofrigidensis]
MEVAVLDACILFQGKLTDLLLCLAEAKAFEPVWSDEIHLEWKRNLALSMSIPMDKIDYRHAEMERAFPAANVPGSASLTAMIQAMCKTAAQRKDAHVVASAVNAEAGSIVTHNIKDFHGTVLAHYRLAKHRPDPFCAGLLASQQAEALAGLRAHRASLKRTPMNATEYVNYLAGPKFGMAKLSTALRDHLGSI